ncbi:MAG: 50S ribosomal protein L32e [Candidatus Marsarchaeota archaeon]|nr:50S ribosomal protein L32e [Candidatus Marsarchaeota archaeon]
MSKQIEHGLKKSLSMRKNLPEFNRPNYWTRSKLSDAWRRPKGIDHKVRHSYKGYPPSVKIGYRTPKKYRGIHPSGLLPVRVQTIEELSLLDPKTNCVILSASLGRKKATEIESAANEKGFVILNGHREEGGEEKDEEGSKK